MARPQEFFNKKEFEKRKAQKKKEKEERKQERKANPKSGLDDMIAYVDENGNFSSTPPDPLKKRAIQADAIVTGSRNVGGAVNTVRTGKVSMFNAAKGFGFIVDSENDDRVFVHMNALKSAIKENDIVTFETERTPKGLQAKDVKLVK
ncbi:MAG TPA: cold shock domain-containing protein [Cyclobacteriaceae bacterium]